MLLDETRQTLKVDITTGDSITPRAVNYAFKLLFEDRTIEINAYTLETVLAEKLETIFSRGTANTQMRDFYDVYILTHTRKSDISDSVLGSVFARTVQKRGSDFLLRENLGQAVQTLKDSPEMLKLWERYQKKYAYACDIPWQDAVDSVLELTNGISMTEQQGMDMKMEF